MRLKEYLRKQLMIFVVLVTCISFVMGVSGCIFDSERQFGYYVLFAPMIYAGLYLLLQFIQYSRKELTMKQYIFRCFLQFLAYEAIILSYSICVVHTSASVTIVLALCVPIVEVIANVMIWFLSSIKAKEMKKELFDYQERHRS